MHPLQKNRPLGQKYAIVSAYPTCTDTLSVIKCSKNNSLVVQNFTKYLFLALLCRFCPMKSRNQTLPQHRDGRGPPRGIAYMYTYSATHGVFTFSVLK